jgi:hypothetical protein
MPIDFYADFRTPSTKKEDQLWSSLALGFAMAFVEQEPRIRMRIRNLPRSVSNVGDQRPSEYMPKANNTRYLTGEDTSLTIFDLPKVLQKYMEIPPAKKFWAGLYHCKTCDKKVYEVQMQKKLHEGHDVERIRIVKRGIKPQWDVDFRLCMGPTDRLAGVALPTYSIAITAPPVSLVDLSGKAAGPAGYGYHAVLLVPLRKGFDYEAEKQRIMDGVPDCEKVEVLPANPKDIPAAILAFVKKLDLALLEPEDAEAAKASTDSVTELKEQLNKEGFEQLSTELDRLAVAGKK